MNLAGTEGGGNGHSPNKCRRTLYLPEERVRKIESEAGRLDRSLSWVVQRAWKIAQEGIKKLSPDET
jgi:uncharacterized small protein (TIGR04563 family)